MRGERVGKQTDFARDLARRKTVGAGTDKQAEDGKAAGMGERGQRIDGYRQLHQQQPAALAGLGAQQALEVSGITSSSP